VGPTPRDLWQATEGLHAIAYFAPEVSGAVAATGVRGWWRGYFAGRAAPMGAVGAAVVSATFANFAPAMVAQALPSAWAMAEPQTVARARLEGVDAALERVDGPAGADGAVATAIVPVLHLLERAADAVPAMGRPLAAAWSEHRIELLDGGPVAPLTRAWLATTVLREHRGDAHVAALAEAGLDGCEAHVTLAGTGRVPGELLREARGWSEDDWAEAVDRLRSRGLLGPEGLLTAAGRDLRGSVEVRTDRAAAIPWRILTDDEQAAAFHAVRPVGGWLADVVPIRVPNPMGWEPLEAR
jgi:hypothetical protein